MLARLMSCLGVMVMCTVIFKMFMAFGIMKKSMGGLRFLSLMSLDVGCGFAL